MLIIAFIASIIFVPNNISHELFMRYLLIVFSWPGAVIALVLILLFLFRAQIAILISRPLEFRIGDASLRINQTDTSADLPPPIEEAQVEKATAPKKEMLPEAYRNQSPEQLRLIGLLFEYIFFERMIRTMFRSQFQLILAVQAKSFISIKEASDFYGLYRTRRGSISYPFEAYTDWLVNWAFVQRTVRGSDYGYGLTPRGIEFLKYTAIMKYSENEFPPL